MIATCFLTFLYYNPYSLFKFIFHYILCYLFIVPSEPQSLEIISITSSSVTLQWMPPVTPNGIITQYSIQFNATVINNFGNNMLNMLMGTVEGLSPDTVYTLQLTAYTSVGEGQPSNIAIITRELLIWSY